MTSLLVVFGVAFCIRLGIWQLDRLAERRAFNAHYLTVSGMPVLDINTDNKSDYLSMEYRAVTAVGMYDSPNQVALLNFYSNGVYGYHLMTPLLLDDGKAVLVDRGWIPADGNQNPEGWKRYDEKDKTVVKGFIRLGVTRVPFGGRADPTLTPGMLRLDFWNFVNLERLSTQIPYPILPFYIQVASKSDDTSLPIPSGIEVELTEGPHLGYALQWFTFATLLLVGYPFYVRRQESSPQ